MRNNKTVVLFLVKFFGTYLLLFLMYSFYLKTGQSNVDGFSCAPITETVAKQSELFLEVFGYEVDLAQNDSEFSIQFIVEGNYVAKIIEGCTSISIIILFISFVIAFASGIKKTVLFIVVGAALIYFINIARIGIIAVAIHTYPEYEGILHDFVFPSIIYGFTFLLWFLWVFKFSKK